MGLVRIPSGLGGIDQNCIVSGWGWFISAIENIFKKRTPININVRTQAANSLGYDVSTTIVQNNNSIYHI